MSFSAVSAVSLSSHSKAPLRVSINGFGRIGRNVLRALIERFEVLGKLVHIVAINDVADADTLLHLLRFDSTHGRLSSLGVEASIKSVGLEHNQLCLTKQGETYCIDLLTVESPEQLPWQSLNVDVVLECTGHFRSYEDASRHLTAGAKQVIVGAAPFDKVDASIVMGVNDQLLTRDLPIISSVSCTTQALVPLIYVLDKAFGTESVMMTEIHAVTADQNVLDQPHRDKRRARASGHNIIPTTSSSIAATERTLPNMLGKINGHSIRVPTIDVAAIDVNFVFKQEVDLEQVRTVLKAACEPGSSLYGIMAYTDLPLVSSDFIHQPESLIIDGQQLMQVGSQVKVFAWYDNEWGYANRLLDMCLYLHLAK
ncbi:type I glyceraldehyde-3-phosphate dehydrogenase [Psychrobacter sanguinis]|uniref:type I glyceraldehyde-3-phosphate dehydrogenase n=1 Tax=Psychrobacter sanguinis TaxID=861445 RepID=UPI00020C7AD4|nr:type I glyceraldehyde-3-phosphate dehydrogenase [Psychrobacter sanguinis]EGK11269.1 glyceraldehyde 3-phosphate dehydrogenase [Psychrobacter sp. 1501(2011)]MCC3307422.1 glyceraldehyde-3-phosphate dehydrogenase [Psychrobacter sanguinis]MCD9152703.1 glyceraldehyde-3-phosphate dehydrogenase [Psychrobacter sanguinis]MDY3306816.1 type I glyceraldehyde-3-phosphate dehydrogenase [Psychrobacter sanguinis]UEC24759.1 glyceraldehyde-3-phosphate dehydrogenase [Psychrobacter sanguinis]